MSDQPNIINLNWNEKQFSQFSTVSEYTPLKNWSHWRVFRGSDFLGMYKEYEIIAYGHEYNDILLPLPVVDHMISDDRILV